MMGGTEFPIVKGLCGAVVRVNMDASGGAAEGKAYLGFALSSELRRHGGRV